MLEDDGWVPVAQKGSHRQFKHPIKKGRTVIGKPSDDLGPLLENSILKQSGLNYLERIG